jgi:hypothetical protein
MKRSKEIRLGLLASTAAALIGCDSQPHYDVHRQCVDANQVVVDNRYCEQQPRGTPMGYPYRWYYYGGSNYGHSIYVPAPFGQRASGGSFASPAGSPSGTVRGMFGGTAEGHGFGGGAGE